MAARTIPRAVEKVLRRLNIMNNNYALQMAEFIEQHPTAFHVVEGQAKLLQEAGYQRLCEGEDWSLQAGKGYFATRNGSAIIAFRMPETKDFNGFMIMASHSDSPCFKIKENPEMDVKGLYVKLNVEGYGGTLLAPWFDRPLSVAGRVCVKTEKGLETVNVLVDRDLILIPNLAIHMNRDVNKGYEYHIQKDMLPLFTLTNGKTLLQVVAEECGVEKDAIVSSDLFVFNRQKHSVWGADKEFLSCPKIDDVLCGYCSLMGFLEAAPSASVPVHVIYDNEEVGSSSRQGAQSTFLKDVLTRICEALGMNQSQYMSKIASSFMLSGDNGHAMHPNYTEKCDPSNNPGVGRGILLKFSANQKYTTDAISAAVVRAFAEKAGVPLQVFMNHSDVPGGSTLGNLSQHQLPLLTADIGAAQLAMHSPYETVGVADVERMVALSRQAFSSSLKMTGDGNYQIL
ncbi:MAG: M18 family aminopeptidase [Firmicutes bacterium]|nr:M18 family aminopeptidase [Bacillota bacterium]